MEMFELDNKTFKIVVNDGPGAEVTTDTIFYFHQSGPVVHADYRGGGVVFGKLLGLLNGDRMEHRYIQINSVNEFNSGHSSVQLERTATGKIRILDHWEWESQTGQGFCIFEEV